MKQLNTYITEKLHLRPGIRSQVEDYSFKVLIWNCSSRKSTDILAYYKDHYHKDITEKLIAAIEIDKSLYEKHVCQRDKGKIIFTPVVSQDSIYWWRTDVNRNGYCVVYDPFANTNQAAWMLLVTKAASKVGKTLRAVEYVEPEEYSEKAHEFDSSDGDIPKIFFDDINDGWDYIEKKYGKF